MFYIFAVLSIINNYYEFRTALKLKAGEHNFSVDFNHKFQMQKKPGFPFIFKNANLYQQDYQSLSQGQWLTSELIHLTFLLLQQQFHHSITKLLDPNLVSYLLFQDDHQQLSKLSKLNLFDYEYLLIPINTNIDRQSRGDHWSLAVFDVKGWRMEVFDSFGRMVENVGCLRDAIGNLYHVLRKEEKGRPEVSQRKNIPKQSNSYDCGVYTIGYAEGILQSIQQGKSLNEEIDWKNIDFKGMRKKIKGKIDQMMK